MQITPQNPVAAKLKASAELARASFYAGEITYEQAQTQVKPFIDYVNQRGKQLATKNGQRWRNITFSGFMR